MAIAADPSTWTPDAASIQRLEASIHPGDYPKWGYAGSPPNLAGYSRYYAGYKRDGHRMLAGEFVELTIEGEKPAGIHIVATPKNFPVIYDGGCSVINVLYDVDAARLVSLTCNGRA